MAAYAAVVSLMNNIHQIINHPHLSTSFDNHQMQHLLETAGSLLRFIEANNYGGGSREAQDLERQIASAAHAAEDVIESHLVAQIQAGTSKNNLVCLLDLQQKIQDMDAVMKKAHEFKGSKGLGEEQPTPVMEIGETAMVGLDAELSKLLDKLTLERPSNLHTISIVGMGGMGKTTLAKNIYENQLIKHHFDLRAWASISQQHSAKQTLSQLLRGLGKFSNNDLGQLSNDDLGLHLHKNLSGRRYLIILDDIWSVKAWDEVRRFFPDYNNGSRIVLTTRLLNVAKDCGSSPFIMKFLDEYSSRKLFCEIAFKNESCPPELEEVSDEIVKLCKGLALSIVVMGGLFFKSPKTVEHWKGFVEDIKGLKEKQESLDVLSLSYTHLPPHLKPCFLYMGVFEEDSQIRVSNVVKLWVAEGFIKPNGSQVLEEIGEGYLKDLIDRNLILVGGLSKNGKIRSCGIHDLVRDLCIKVAEQQEFFHMINEDYIIRGSERRLICTDSNRIQGLPLVRCVMTRDYRVGQPNKKELLRVLNCQSLYYSDSKLYRNDQNQVDSAAELFRNYYQTEVDIAAEFYRNVNLRYLAYNLYESTDWEIPSCASLLWNLQTLIIKASLFPWLVVASEFWKMRQLRHVDCHMISLPQCNGGDDMRVLENLQTLKTAVNVSLSEEVCKSIPNIKKLGLLFDPYMHGYDDCLIENLCNLGRLDKLESLKMEIPGTIPQLNEKLRFPSSLNKLCLSMSEKVCKSIPSSLFDPYMHGFDGCLSENLCNLGRLDKLESLKLEIPGTIPQLNEKLIFPSSLNKLRLSRCGLKWEDVSVMVGSLPQLQVLILEEGSVCGREWSPVNGQFLHLKFLKINHAELQHWDADKFRFPVLEKLLLSRMWHLKEIPEGIGDIPTLELIRLEGCSLSVAISAIKIKEVQLDYGNDSLQIEVRVSELEVEDFKERVESEGLSISNIHLEY